MANAVDERHFIPFVPRTIGSLLAPEASAEPQEQVEMQAEFAPRLDPPPQADPDLEAPKPSEPQADEAVTSRPPFSAALHAALQTAAIAVAARGEAIRLACIATGRILRHALVVDPKIIARFVDDALAAACDEAATARVNPAHLPALADQGMRCIADERLGFGEVVVDLPAGSIGATVEERAELIVRAAADG